MDISIATLNLCLGLLNKKEEVKRLITEQKLDVLCMQETELPSDYPARLLSFRDYQIEVEVNSQKSRVAVYIKNCVKFTRQYMNCFNFYFNGDCRLLIQIAVCRLLLFKWKCMFFLKMCPLDPMRKQ